MSVRTRLAECLTLLALMACSPVAPPASDDASPPQVASRIDPSSGGRSRAPGQAVTSTVLLPGRPASTATPPAPTVTPQASPSATSVPATSTPAPTATLARTATPAPTLTAAEIAQQQFCDAAAPPGQIPLPPPGLTIRIPLPDVQTQPTPVVNGPHLDGPDPPPHVTAPSIAVLDETSGALLYALNPFERRAPASITKIATVIVALERGPDVNTVFTTTVSASALVPCDGSSVMGLEPADHVKLETLLFGMMLPSGNDAAEQVAYSLAGSRDRYVQWMNDEVSSLHLRDTHFVSPSGMDIDGHYSSAYDMALLARYAMRNPEFRMLAATPSKVSDDYYMRNLNPLLGSYRGADGVKIGYTDIAGRTIVASATRDGHRVYVSLMGSRNLAGDSVALFDWVWQSFRW